MPVTRPCRTPGALLSLLYYVKCLTFAAPQGILKASMDESSAGRASPRTAHDDLQYIRRTLAAAGHLSIVPGKGLMAIGALALGATSANYWVTGAPWEATPIHWEALGIWGLLLVVSFVIGAATMKQKARRTGQTFWSPVLRKAMWGYISAMVLGAILSFSVIQHGRPDALAEVWLGCYGAAVMAAGAVSVSPVRWMGICFLALAGAAVAAPASLGLPLLGLGFGALHFAFGAYIAWRHEG